MVIKNQVMDLIKRFATNNPFEICDYLNITILFQPLKNMRGYFYQNSIGDIIVLNSNLNQTTARFVCAHELGHAILHGGLNRVFLDSLTLTNTAKCEKEANLFGMYLLYPEDNILFEHGDTSEKIAMGIGLSENLVQLRLQNAVLKGELE